MSSNQLAQKAFRTHPPPKPFSDYFTSRNRAQQWVQRWHLPTLTFSWVHWNPESFLKQPPLPYIGRDAQIIHFQFGLIQKRAQNSSSRALMAYTQASTSPLNFEITFLDLCLYKGERFTKKGILDIRNHIKPTNTQQYVHASSATPLGQARVSSKENYLGTFEQTRTKLHSKCTKKNISRL